jgi:hypothetical protein
MKAIRLSLCPNCDACPEVVATSEAVTIGEEGNQVRLSPDEWNVLVAAIKAGDLDVIDPPASTGDGGGIGGCCAE